MVPNSAKRYLQRLIAEGEHQQQDFKYRVEDAAKLARSVSAFANSEGGRLLIGVRDDGQLCGVRSEEEIYVMHQAAYRHCRPEASIKFDTYHVEGRTIVVATVPPAGQRPVCAVDAEGRQRAYVRLRDENIVASPVHIAVWRQEQARQGIAFTYGDDERRLLSVLPAGAPMSPTGAGLTLGAVTRATRLPRHRVVTLLARLVRYGLVSMRFDGHAFCFALSDP